MIYTKKACAEKILKYAHANGIKSSYDYDIIQVSNEIFDYVKNGIDRNGSKVNYISSERLFLDCASHYVKEELIAERYRTAAQIVLDGMKSAYQETIEDLTNAVKEF